MDNSLDQAVENWRKLNDEMARTVRASEELLRRVRELDRLNKLKRTLTLVAYGMGFGFGVLIVVYFRFY